MGSRFDIFEIYSHYCDIVSRNCPTTSKDSLSVLSKALEPRLQMRDTIFNDIYKLMLCLDLSLDSRQFSLFYDFVFFMCRENGQKNITVNRAVKAWRLVLNGRFRLLNRWCEFVQKHQRHNISEDIWQQLLAFSRCVNEDLEGYDPQGAWPVIIDEFVEHMYRMTESRSSGFVDTCGCSDMEPQPSISCTFNGLNLHAGSKRRWLDNTDEQLEETAMSLEKLKCSSPLITSKRLRQASVANLQGHSDFSTADGTPFYPADTKSNGSLSCLQSSAACAVDDSLSKGFEGYLSIGSCFQIDQKSGVYT